MRSSLSEHDPGRVSRTGQRPDHPAGPLYLHFTTSARTISEPLKLERNDRPAIPDGIGPWQAPDRLLARQTRLNFGVAKLFWCRRKEGTELSSPVPLPA
jgi:hypothetical protein